MKCKNQKEKWTDPSCTPGAIDKTLTLEVMTMQNFGTACVRNQANVGRKEAGKLYLVQDRIPDKRYGEESGLRT